MFEIMPESTEANVSLRATGRLTHADYQAILPELERRISAHGRIGLLADMTGFEGWTLRAAWDDFVLGLRHLAGFNRIALVGDRRWEELCASIGNHLIRAEVRFFHSADKPAAWAWVCGPPGA